MNAVPPMEPPRGGRGLASGRGLGGGRGHGALQGHIGANGGSQEELFWGGEGGGILGSFGTF